MWGAILSWLLGLLFKRAPAPSREAVAAKEAGSAETALQTERVSNEAIIRASADRDSAVRSVATDGGLREYEATDPLNRDNG